MSGTEEQTMPKEERIIDITEPITSENEVIPKEKHMSKTETKDNSNKDIDIIGLSWDDKDLKKMSETKAVVMIKFNSYSFCELNDEMCNPEYMNIEFSGSKLCFKSGNYQRTFVANALVEKGHESKTFVGKFETKYVKQLCEKYPMMMHIFFCENNSVIFNFDLPVLGYLMLVFNPEL